MKLRVGLEEIDSRRGVCAKPNCDTGSYRLNRHHTRHEYLFIAMWVSRFSRLDWYEEMVERYHEYHKDDIIWICTPHHAEIHQIYDKIIHRDMVQRRTNLYSYSRSSGEQLMDDLHDACMKWLQEETPGIDPETFDKNRRTRRKPRKKKR